LSFGEVQPSRMDEDSGPLLVSGLVVSRRRN
jgi:hypothetical protein